MSFDWYLDPLTGDLPRTFRGTRQGELVLQRIRVRLRTMLGEVWEKKTEGLPFVRWATYKQPDLDEVAAYMRNAVQTIPGVLRVENVGTVYETNTQTLRTSMTVISPTDGAFRVRIDLLDGASARETGAGALTGSDPVPVVASPIIVVEFLDAFIGL
jgi:hypothetical protein